MRPVALPARSSTTPSLHSTTATSTKPSGLFDVIRLQYPASEFAPDAQYYLAEISFRRREYVVASFNYSMVRRQYPTHPRAREALYKAALCYVELAPPYDRDQEYTRKAIAALAISSVSIPRIRLLVKLSARYGAYAINSLSVSFR
ncbi:MAG: hypothetical protein KatS3mg040_0625 [Candidatus Kapaibacterium sp.]|nr:MAG: hypothetical protein KatS3mg040_0625 [Candidatus Kapabacteria bacterium]